MNADQSRRINEAYAGHRYERRIPASDIALYAVSILALAVVAWVCKFH